MAYKGTVDNIANAFSTAFRQSRDQMQREREFKQKMAEEERQFGLLQRIREQNAVVDKQRADDYSRYIDYQTTPAPVPEPSYYNSEQYFKDKQQRAIELERIKAGLKPKDGNTTQWKPPKNFYETLPDNIKGSITNKDGNVIPRTNNEITVGETISEGEVLDSMPVNARSFFQNNLASRNIGVRSAMSLAIKAREEGKIDDNDLDAILFYYQNTDKFQGHGTARGLYKKDKK